MNKTQEALKLALEALTHFEKAGLATLKTVDAITAIREALTQPQEKYQYGTPLLDAMTGKTEQPAIKQDLTPEQPAQQQEPVSDALHFAQWTAAKKDLSDYILVGSLSLAGIEDGEYGTSEIDPLDNTIEALQEKLVTGPDHKKVPLLAYIGALNNTSPQPAQPSKPWVGLTEEEIQTLLSQNRFAVFALARAIEAKLREKNA